MRWILWSGGERGYGETEPDDAADMGPDHVATQTDIRDYPRGENGDNFFWKLLIFPFRAFITEQGDIGVGTNGESFAPLIGAVSAEKLERTAESLGGDLDGAMEHYDKKFKSRKSRH